MYLRFDDKYSKTAMLDTNKQINRTVLDFYINRQGLFRDECFNASGSPCQRARKKLHETICFISHGLLQAAQN